MRAKQVLGHFNLRSSTGASSVSTATATPSAQKTTVTVTTTTHRTLDTSASSTPSQTTDSAAPTQNNAGTAATNDSDDDDDDDDSDSNNDGGLKSVVGKLTGFIGLGGAHSGGHSKREVSVTPGKNETFIVSGLPGESNTINLSKTCIETLIYPVQTLSNTKREDVTLIAFQFWVMSMSLVAILNESIPHLSAALMTQLLVTVWSAIQVANTANFRKEFFRLTFNGACRQQSLLGNYWKPRLDAEIASTVLNGVALLLMAIMTYKLIKVYSWQTYKRIGASLAINRIYKLVLCLSMLIQLTLFAVVATAGLWIDQLYNGSVAQLSANRTVYEGGIFVMAILLPPWLTLGWFAIRREWRVWSLVFLALNVVFVTMYALIFDSKSFRWTLSLWRFFLLMAILSGLLLLGTLGLGLACRLNFGKGLPTYLNVQEPIEGIDFAPVYPDGKDPEMGDYKSDMEKIDFPSSGGGNESVNFATQQGSGDYSYGNGYPGSLGSFGSIAGTGSDALRSPERVAYPTHLRSGSVSSGHLSRTDTQSSHGSQNSISSMGSTGSRGAKIGMGKRWVIE
ncbi:hypothetical protein M422DRAFT_207072 [Sphaerobolus stellatus SS14]|uniref:Unplaced genomic scaffold SPHSTscaffold_36, whole genome shotgun sequence n=1 Tax=Sphaerobolus stellatus (strain SS14) TaxID=990650 RepID=A0A0C9W280_SPHS4|nr:hypothetical protein M422DRAFT_207072 [Sphaerobolus stellatus SS14]